MCEFVPLNIYIKHKFQKGPSFFETFHFHPTNDPCLKGVLHPCALFLKTLCIFSKNKATLNKVSYGSGQKCSKELKNHSFTSVETIVAKLQ